jgi:hypothetical protein
MDAELRLELIGPAGSAASLKHNNVIHERIALPGALDTPEVECSFSMLVKLRNNKIAAVGKGAAHFLEEVQAAVERVATTTWGEYETEADRRHVARSQCSDLAAG